MIVTLSSRLQAAVALISHRMDEYRLFGGLVSVAERQKGEAIAGSMLSEGERRT